MPSSNWGGSCTQVDGPRRWHSAHQRVPARTATITSVHTWTTKTVCQNRSLNWQRPAETRIHIGHVQRKMGGGSIFGKCPTGKGLNLIFFVVSSNSMYRLSSSPTNHRPGWPQHRRSRVAHQNLFSSQWLMSLSMAPGLSCTAKRSTMVALASLRPSTSTSAPSRRNLITTLSSAATAVMSQKWA